MGLKEAVRMSAAGQGSVSVRQVETASPRVGIVAAAKNAVLVAVQVAVGIEVVARVLAATEVAVVGPMAVTD